MAFLAILLTGCGDPFDAMSTHHSAHIGGYIGIVDVESTSLPGLDGYSNISSYFPESHDEYMYFVKKYIFEKWDSNGPSGKVQFWRKSTFSEDWIDKKEPVPGGTKEVPFTCDLCYENGGVYLSGSSWQQPWLKFSWKVNKVSSDEIILVSEKSDYYFKIVKGEKIEAAEAYSDKSNDDKYRD